MARTSDKNIKNILDYKATHHYFGDWSPADINAGYGAMRRSQVLDTPIFTYKVKIGVVNGDVICRALWHEMSYNPLRFGKDSPFLHNGKPNIYHFCRNHVQQMPTKEAFAALWNIRNLLIKYMQLNAGSNGQWQDVMPETDGWATMRFINGHSGPVFKKLKCLRECIKIITKQNLDDLQNEPYRTEIIRTVLARHPKCMGDEKNANTPTAPATYETNIDDTDELSQARLDDALDNLQITMDNHRYVSADQYEQAIHDRDQLIANITDGHIH